MKNITKSSKKSNKTQKSKVFQPLIASSLALALGVSVNYGSDVHGQSGSYDINQVGDYRIYLDVNATGNYTVNVGNQYDIGITGQIGGQSIHGADNTGNLIVNFKNGSSLEGKIQTGLVSNGNDFSSNQVTFSGGGSWSTVLTGDIVSYGTGSGGRLDTYNGNHVTFQAGSMQGNIQALSTNPSDANWKTYGYNIVTFSGSSAQTMTGSITAEGGENEIIFSGTGAKKITGNITAQNSNSRSGKNTIKSTADQLTLGSGNGSDISASNATNSITATNLVLNIGTMSSTSTDIKIDAYNKIDASSSLEIQSGTITAANLGNNYITAGSLILNNTTFDSGTSGNTAKNLLEAGNTDINGNVIIKANNKQNNNTVKLNALKFTGSVTMGSNGKISEITAIAYNDSTGVRANARNVLSFDGGGAII